MSAEMEADIAFLLLRAGCAGSCSFSSDRWTGQSSNALVALAYGGKQTAMPWDRSDYAACVRTVRRLPRHRRTAAVMDGLKAAREHYLSRHPNDRNSLVRRAELEEWRAEQLRKTSKRKRR
jgi:hypothetical protein